LCLLAIIVYEYTVHVPLLAKKEIVTYIWELIKLLVELRQQKMQQNSKSKYDSMEQLKKLFSLEVFFRQI
jgi:hypothetical protein